MSREDDSRHHRFAAVSGSLNSVLGEIERVFLRDVLETQILRVFIYKCVCVFHKQEWGVETSEPQTAWSTLA